MRRARMATMLAVVALGGFGVAACGGDDQATADPVETTAAATTTGTLETETETTTTTTADDAESGTKVSANTASQEEVTIALEAAGVANAERWAREVLEYRPYDESDPTLAELRKELLKYNPSADELERILGALQP